MGDLKLWWKNFSAKHFVADAGIILRKSASMTLVYLSILSGLLERTSGDIAQLLPMLEPMLDKHVFGTLSSILILLVPLGRVAREAKIEAERASRGI